jgi:hypothetical protein
LISSGVRNGIGERRLFPYAPIERLILLTLSELSPADLESEPDPTAPLEGRLAEAESKIAAVQAKIETEGGIDALLDTLTALGRQRKAIADELEAARLARIAPSALGEAQSLVAKATDPDVRRNLKAKLRSLIDSIWILVVDEGKTDRYARVQIFFKSGNLRILSAHWKRKGTGRGHVCGGYCGEGLVGEQPEFDLRLYRVNPDAVIVDPVYGVQPIRPS